MNAFDLKILAPDRVFFEGKCLSLVVPTVDGLYGIQAKHENLILAIASGTMHFRTEEASQEAAISGGIVKVENGSVLLLTDSVLRPEEIDLAAAEREATQAQEELLQKRSAQEHRMAQERLSRALGQIQTKRRRK